MAYRFNCRSCYKSEYIYVETVSENDSEHECPNCGAFNVINKDWYGLEEIDDDGNILTQTQTQTDNDLSILNDYKFFIGFLMLMYSGYVVYTFYKLSDYLTIETVLPLAVNYIIIFVIFLSLRKIISFLNKQSKMNE